VAGQPPRQKTERPRDELGRPLPWDQENRLELEDFDSLSQEENHRLGIRHFNEGRFFQAHEAWETAWKQGRGTPDEEFFKGLSQLGAGYVHYRRDNPHGAKTLIRRGTGRLGPFGPEHLGVGIERLVREAEDQASAIEAAERDDRGLPELTPPRI
jgi:uncharacterized protein